MLVGLASSLVIVFAWYLPHTNDIAGSALADYGHRIHVQWLGTAPIDQTLVPALTQLDDDFVAPSLWSLLWSCALWLLLLATSPLIRQPRTAFLLCSGVVSTVLAFWITGTYVVPRFLSFLLVPLFILLATGSRRAVAQDTNQSVRRRVRSQRSPHLDCSASSPFRSSSTCQGCRATLGARPLARSTNSSLVRRPCSPTSRTPVILAFHLGRAVRACVDALRGARRLSKRPRASPSTSTSPTLFPQ